MGRYDLVLCFTEMPYMTGIDVAGDVKGFSAEGERNPSFILITGSRQQVCQEETEVNEIDVVMAKALRLDHLLETIKTLSCAE